MSLPSHNRRPPAPPAAAAGLPAAVARRPRPARPIVFLGPSMPLAQAKEMLPTADYRPPARRGDLDALPPGTVVGLIDGCFDQELSLSHREVHNAILRDIAILGSSSMGALRASEVRGVQGTGRVYEMYRDGVMDRDDEVALLFDPVDFRPLTTPLVNVRYAVDSLVRAGTIDSSVGQRILAAAREMHFSERQYPRILRRAGLSGRSDVTELADMLAAFDLKREDAQLLLERLPDFVQRAQGRPPAGRPAGLYDGNECDDHWSTQPLAVDLPADTSVLIWEYGDDIAFSDLLAFLKLTGQFERHARAAVARFVVQGNEITARLTGDCKQLQLPDRGELLRQIYCCWGWLTAEEARVTLRDLGLGSQDLVERLDEEIALTASVAALTLARDPQFLKALRAELLLDELALKRAVLRLGSLQYFARLGRERADPIADAERRAAETAVLAAGGYFSRNEALASLARYDISESTLKQLVDDVAYARRAAQSLASVLWAPAREAGRRLVIPRRVRTALGIGRSLKAGGSLRFCLPFPEAEKHVRRIAANVGITRVAMVGELTKLGIQVSQAYRPHSDWSSTAGSGKGSTRAAARIGGILEEAEKFAQERVTYDAIIATCAELGQRAAVLDPTTLDLPFDSIYHADLAIAWARCDDLLSGKSIFVPAAAIDRRRLHNDIFYSARRGRKVFSTNGLASGFTAAEALLHAACELIERHAVYLAELRISNPGRLGPRQYTFVDLSTVPAPARRLVEQYERAGLTVRALDVTSEIKVPTFEVRLVSNRSRSGSAYAPGYAAHPNAAVALHMALLEAGQTLVGNVAGAREDITIKARSLGRHQRPRATHADAERFWFGDESAPRSLNETSGYESADVLRELEWVLRQVATASLPHVLAADYTIPEVAPARVFRVLIPGLESLNPFYIGPRARAWSIRDLLAQGTGTAP